MVENKPSGRSQVVQRQTEEKNQRLRLIRDAALQVFAQKGYAGTSMADIARAARLGKATLYYYFPNKDALYQAVYVSGTNAYYAAMMPVLEAEPIDRLFRTMFRFYVDYMHEHPDFLKIFFPLGRSAPMALLTSPEVQQLSQHHREALDQLLQSKLAPIPAVKRELLMQVLWTFLMGLNQKLLRQIPSAQLHVEIDLINRFMLQYAQE
ncbi:MAG: TetR/AcrR family transcriptional regulator [Lentisphaeria bacterium]|nr:TetR/AcrR family transcriptional regulator [Candidatus Neomarinimicrobiota bacterium]MCF7841735.1 TetR/AcrR family transcriptional regulator [Lentisphaeria bacterium]